MFLKLIWTLWRKVSGTCQESNHISSVIQPVPWWLHKLVWKQVIRHQILEPLHAEISGVIILHPDDKCTMNHQRTSAWSHLRRLYNKKNGPKSTIKMYKMEWIVLFEKHVTCAIPSIYNSLILKSSVTIKLFQNGNDSIACVEEIYLLCLNKLCISV